MPWVTGLVVLLLALFAVYTDAQGLFHRTSIVLYPNATSTWPSDSTFVAANFYCYFTPVGYLSFGWWLPATPGANHTQCDPHSSSYHWFEYTASAHCVDGRCKVHAINYMTSNTSVPYVEDDYVLAALDLGNGRLGELGLSYFDKPGGGYAVGTRRPLDDDSVDWMTVNNCHDAFHTLDSIREKYDLNLSFSLENNCPARSRTPGHLRGNTGWQKAFGFLGDTFRSHRYLHFS